MVTYMESHIDEGGDFHIKMETKDGMTRWLETESTSERTYVFEVFYDEDAVCRSEELVAWCYGELESEDDVIDHAKSHNLKAEYTL